MTIKKMFGAAVLAGALAFPMAGTTEAQPPVVIGGGLVNVQIVDVIDDIVIEDINVFVPVGIAANIIANVCGLSVGVLASDLAQGNTVVCDGEIQGAPVEVTASR